MGNTININDNYYKKYYVNFRVCDTVLIVSFLKVPLKRNYYLKHFSTFPQYILIRVYYK